MQVAGVPNDVLTNLNPLALIIMIPLLDTFVYPALRKFRLNPTPLKRIAIGYFVAASAMIWACVIQYYIYKTNECGHWANGVLEDGTEVECANSPINMWAQSGAYILIAFSEIMASITSLEYAHSKAPANMRSMVQSVALFMNAISSAIGFALVSLAKDPLLVWNYATVAILAVIGGTMFWIQMRGLDKQEDELNMLPKGEVGDVVASAQFEEGEKNASKA
jgi:POT family proton-dependent oligopeptide transporter